MSDPFARPLDRLLWAQRIAFGPHGYRPDPDSVDRWHVTCPRCLTAWRTATVTEAEGGGEITFSCSEGCSPEKIADSARSMVRFYVDQEDTPILPLTHNPVEGWSVKVPLRELAEMHGGRA